MYTSNTTCNVLQLHITLPQHTRTCVFLCWIQNTGFPSKNKIIIIRLSCLYTLLSKLKTNLSTRCTNVKVSTEHQQHWNWKIISPVSRRTWTLRESICEGHMIHVHKCTTHTRYTTHVHMSDSGLLGYAGAEDAWYNRVVATHVHMSAHCCCSTCTRDSFPKHSGMGIV